MNLYQETKFLMNKYNIIASKRLGQNFLINDTIVDDIIQKSGVNSQDLIIEVGPGLGNLTSRLLEKAGKVISIELDPKMIDILNDRFSLYDNFELIYEDILKIDLKKLISDNLNDNIKTAKVVANLPYYITTPIIMKLLEENLNLKSITVMVQKEVAERLAATPGDKLSGAITYSIYYYTTPEIIIDVPSSSFIPEPQVDSAVIKFDILKEPRIKVIDEKLFFKVIKSAFLQKRKTLVNTFLNSNIFENKEKAEEMLLDLGLDIKIRGEKLSLEDFAKITEYIKNM